MNVQRQSVTVTTNGSGAAVFATTTGTTHMT